MMTCKNILLEKAEVLFATRHAECRWRVPAEVKLERTETSTIKGYVN